MKWDVYVRNRTNKYPRRLLVRVNSIAEVAEAIEWNTRRANKIWGNYITGELVYYVRSVRDESNCEWCASLSQNSDDMKFGDLIAKPYVEYTYYGDGAPCSIRARYCPMCGRKIFGEEDF